MEEGVRLLSGAMVRELAMDASLRPSADACIEGPNRVVVRTFDHCDQVAEMTRREGDAEFTQLSSGRFSGSTTRLELGDLRVHHTETLGRTLNRARTYERFLYYHVLVRTQELVWEGKTIARPALIQHGGPDEFVRYGRDLEMVALAAPRERLLEDAVALAGRRDEPIRLARGDLGRPGGAAREFMETLLEFARRARVHPSSLHHAGSLEALRRRIERSLVDLLVDQIGARDEGPPPPGSRQRTVRRAQQHLEEAGNRRVTVAELCRAVGVSRRTLEYAFLDICGVSPRRYLQVQRLRAAQRALRRAAPERGAVKREAYDAGFRDLGRFSVEYRRFFGESPTQTLNRT
jgi:AraC family transcriptional regulator, ethanolamine operon transcriptional activator